MLDVTKKKENAFDNDTRKNKMPMFFSRQTLDGCRLTIKSGIAITEGMCSRDYKLVLLGKMNQNILKVRLDFSDSSSKKSNIILFLAIFQNSAELQKLQHIHSYKLFVLRP